MSQTHRPYVVRDSELTVEEIVAQVNEAQWYGYGPDYRAGGIDKVIAGPLLDFETFLGALTASDHFRFVSHRDLAENPAPDPSAVRVAIRHDIDSDIVSALAQAEIEHRLGVVATWLVLHTAPYYGAVDDEGVFARHDAMAPLYRRLQDLGHEVSLHTDPLGLYQGHGIDGAAAVRTELAWLRSHGIDIVGTTAHNHRRTYGAENFEVFRDYVAPDGVGQPADATRVDHDGASAPLRVLDAASLDLRYEGNEILWRKPEVDYCSVRFVNEWAGHWVREQIARSERPELRFVDQDRLITHLRSLPLGTDAVVVIHPEYFGARTAIDRGPILAPEPTAKPQPWSDGGWRHHEPWSVIVDNADGPGRPTVGIAVANEWGMRGLPVEESLVATDPSRRFVVVGGDHTAAPTIAVPAAWPERSARLLSHRTKERWSSFTLADAGMGIDRLWPWIRFGRQQTDATTVVIEVPADVDGNIGPRRWATEAREQGVSGPYLVKTPIGLATRYFTPHADPPELSEESSTTGNGAELYQRCVEALIADGCAIVLVFTATDGSPVPTWATELSALYDDVKIAGPLACHGDESTLTVHRRLSEKVYEQLVALHEQRQPRDTAAAEIVASAPGDSVGGIDPSEPTDSLPEPAQVEAAATDRLLLGLRTYPAPFEAAVAFVSDIDGSTTRDYKRYMTELVHDWGLDHGDSIHVAGYHQRFATDRRRNPTRHRSILNYELRINNSPIGREGSWLAHVLGGYHRGDIDHLHGLYAWGARSLPLFVEAHPDGTSRSRAVNGFRLLPPPPPKRRFSFRRETPKPAVPYALRASNFPLVSCAIRTPSNLLALPEKVTARWPTTSVEMPLVEVLPGPDGTHTAIYVVPVELLSFVDHPPVVLSQLELVGIDIDLPTADVVAAALHNVDRRGFAEAMTALWRRYRLGFDLITTHGRYQFYAQGKLEAIAEELAEEQARYLPDPIALYGAPDGGDPVVVAVADEVSSPAAVQPFLVEHGLRYLTPVGYIARGAGPFDAAMMTFPVVDRSGGHLRYLQRCMPDVSAGVKNPSTSRLSSFETRLENVLVEIDRRVLGGEDGGFWPFYTHLGQTVDLDEKPDPWFGGDGLAKFAHRFWGATEGPRPWLTRASVLANYSEMLQRLPAVTDRDGDRIEITNRSDPNDDPGRPIRCTDLFGITFDVDDAATATLRLDGTAIDEVYRWPDGEAITVLACGVRWPIIDSADPTQLAAIGGDLGACAVTDGTWSWHDAGRRDESHGTLVVGPGGSVTLRVDLDELDVSGAQVAGFAVRADADVDGVEIALGSASGDRLVITDDGDGARADHRLGRLVIELPRQRWTTHHLPLWAADDVELQSRGETRAIRTVVISVVGRPGATVDIGSLWLGRPKTNSVVTDTGVLIGGDAWALPSVDVVALAGDARHRCEVEENGLFVSPQLEPGAWVVEAAGIAPRAIQVDTDRFDLVLRPTEAASPAEPTDTSPHQPRKPTRWRRLGRLGRHRGPGGGSRSR